MNKKLELFLLEEDKLATACGHGIRQGQNKPVKVEIQTDVKGISHLLIYCEPCEKQQVWT